MRRRRHRRRRARRELRRARAARPLDQPRPGERRPAADLDRRAGAEVDHLLAPGGVRLRGDEPGTWPSARGASGHALADGTLKAPPIERHASTPPRGARPARIARHHRRAGPDRLSIDNPHEEATMIVGMNHFTVIAEDRQKTLDFYVGLLGLQRGPPSRPRLRRRLAVRRRTAGDRAPLLRPQAAGAARRRDRPHGVHGQATSKAVKARFDAARHQVRPAPADRLGHLAAVLPRPERRQGRARLRPRPRASDGEGYARPCRLRPSPAQPAPRMAPVPYYQRHIFFCLNERENGEKSCCATTARTKASTTASRA